MAPGGRPLDPASPGHLLPLADNAAEAGAAATLHDGFFYALLHKSLTPPRRSPCMPPPHLAPPSLLQAWAPAG